MGFLDLFSCASDTRERRRIRKQNLQSNSNQDATAPGGSSTAVDRLACNEDGAAHAYESEGVDSFWDIGKYKVALKRCDNGQKLASELSEMISERAKVEDNYG